LHTALLVAAASFPIVAAWLYFVVCVNTPWMRLLYAGCKVAQAAIPLLGWWVLGMERQRPWSRIRGAMVAGLVSGIALGGGILALRAGPLAGWAPLAAAAGPIRQRLVDLGAATPARYLLLALALSVAHSLFEELYWRWFLLGQLQRRMPLPAALVLAGCAFAAHHWIVIDSFLAGRHRLVATLLTLSVAAAGVFWGWLFQRYHSLVAPWISHLLVDAALMALGWQLVWGW
jgi:membrane protease YdiL (CAAX protease family)